MKSRTFLALLALWVAVCVSVLVYFAERRLAYFDPGGAFSMKMTAVESDDEFARLMGKLGFSIDKQVFHYYQSGCGCNLLGSQHRKSVELLAKENGYNNVHIDLSLYPQLLDFIPSIPSVSVFNDSQKLAYIGPYSSGLSCSAGNGLVEGFISSDYLYFGSIVVSQVRGCYCEVKKDS